MFNLYVTAVNFPQPPSANQEPQHHVYILLSDRPGLFVLLSFTSNNTLGHALSSFRDAEMNPMRSVVRALQCYPEKPLEMQILSICEN